MEKLLFTIEKIDVSSAKGFTFNIKLLGRSFIYIYIYMYIYIYIYIFLIEEQGIFVTQNLNIFCFLIIIYRSLIEKNTARVVAAHQNNVLLLWRGIVLFACHKAREAREL